MTLTVLVQRNKATKIRSSNEELLFKNRDRNWLVGRDLVVVSHGQVTIGMVFIKKDKTGADNSFYS